MLFNYKILVIFICIVAVYTFEGRNVFGQIKSGLHLAGKLLGIDQAKGVAQLVSETFGKTYRKGDTAENPNNIFAGFLRILGFDVKKIGAITVNAIIFIAQLISSSLSRPRPSQLTEARKLPPGSPLDWVLKNSHVNNLIEHVRDKELPHYIIEYIKEHSLDEETDCVQLLVCKSSPFIWGMQKALAVKSNETVSGPKVFYFYLPTLEEVEQNGDRCDTKHPFCFIDM